MDITEVSIIHHVGLVLFILWLISHYNCSHPVAYFVSLIYLFLVHERYVMRLRRKLQYDERKQANQKRVLSDSETVRWLNHAVEKIWPICMEQITSQKILLPIIPWFLEKYKPWTAKKAVVQHLYMGRNPPMFTEMRVLRQSNDDDHLVLELGMNFLTADDMSAILAVQLRKRLGFGMSAKLHITGMHVEGKVLVGVKFLREWPFIGRLRVCFVEPPYFQMTVKPIFTHGLDVTELPGIAGWLDKLLSIAFEQTLVEPNMLVVDMEKFVSPNAENWFSVDEKEPVACVRLEVIEASCMKPSDLNGLADPYVKGQLGPFRFKTKIQRKTLDPKWHEEFKIPIVSWEVPNMLSIEVRDKDHFVDDSLGDCSINIGDFRTGQRHDMWLSLQNIKTGKLHLAVTVIEANVKGDDLLCDWESLKGEDKINSFVGESTNKGSFSSASSEKSNRVADTFEPINIEGQKETGVWVHHPGSEVSQTWEPRKGSRRRLDTEIQREPNGSTGGSISAEPGSQNSKSSSDENPDDKRSLKTVRRGLRKIGSVFQRSPKKEDNSNFGETVPSPHVNIRAVNEKEIGVRFVVDEDLTRPVSSKIPKGGASSSGGSSPDSPGKGNMKDKAKSILKHAEKSARSIKHALSRKGSRKNLGESSSVTGREILPDTDYSDDNESIRSPGAEHVSENKSKDDIVGTSAVDTAMDAKGQMKKVVPDGSGRSLDKEACYGLKSVLSDSETVQWLNCAVGKIWPICMEQITSQKILLPIVPWFLEECNTLTAIHSFEILTIDLKKIRFRFHVVISKKKSVVQHLYMGRNPPIFTEIKVLIEVKLLRNWPFFGNLRVCFMEPPYFQLTVKPSFTQGLDVAELPEIAGWMDELLSIAFAQTLVEGDDRLCDWESLKGEDKGNSFASEATNKGSFSSASSEKSNRMADNFESVNIEGQKETAFRSPNKSSSDDENLEMRMANGKEIGVRFVVEEGASSSGGSSSDSPGWAVAEGQGQEHLKTC
ncbi:hypothetical protein FNV43_RR16210 [Rhamnella rubrinervis]|uniref:C2 domain-containing protein n=1 Tax=Rhamnella rubrinervis TaxID=2594499 RepID=A0A8K0EA89_9ROSA|nr:hypothetical protein FNV43_RR16210 [Rhamnella rubrinervis]